MSPNDWNGQRKVAEQKENDSQLFVLARASVGVFTFNSRVAR